MIRASAAMKARQFKPSFVPTAAGGRNLGTCATGRARTGLRTSLVLTFAFFCHAFCSARRIDETKVHVAAFKRDPSIPDNKDKGRTYHNLEQMFGSILKEFGWRNGNYQRALNRYTCKLPGERLSGHTEIIIAPLEVRAFILATTENAAVSEAKGQKVDISAVARDLRELLMRPDIQALNKGPTEEEHYQMLNERAPDVNLADGAPNAVNPIHKTSLSPEALECRSKRYDLALLLWNIVKKKVGKDGRATCAAMVKATAYDPDAKFSLVTPVAEVAEVAAMAANLLDEYGKVDSVRIKQKKKGKEVKEFIQTGYDGVKSQQVVPTNFVTAVIEGAFPVVKKLIESAVGK
jgi:hypothetical protein